MQKASLIFAFVVTPLFLLTSAEADEASTDTPAVIESAELVGFLTHMDELCEMTSEIVFAQSVLLLGGEHGWDIWSSEFAGSGPLFYLFNILEETQLPAIRSIQAVRRNAAITEDDLLRAEGVYAAYTGMAEVGLRVHTLVSEGETDEAAALYLAQTIPMRRQLRADCFTVADGPRQSIASMALDARLGR